MTDPKPLDEAPDGMIDHAAPLECAATVLANSLIYFVDERDQRTVHMLGTSYHFTSMAAATEAMVTARFNFIKSVVLLAKAERSKMQTVHAVHRHLLGDA